MTSPPSRKRRNRACAPSAICERSGSRHLPAFDVEIVSEQEAYGPESSEIRRQLDQRALREVAGVAVLGRPQDVSGDPEFGIFESGDSDDFPQRKQIVLVNMD